MRATIRPLVSTGMVYRHSREVQGTKSKLKKEKAFTN
jgi:hypothetical protein